MNRPRSRWLSLLAAAALLFPAAGCARDTPTRTAAGGRQAAADTTDPTAASPHGATTQPGSPGASAPASTTARPGATKTSTGTKPAGGSTTTTTAAMGGPSPTTTAAGPPSPTTTAPVGACPDARGCPNYKLLGGRWPRDANGTATIHYRIKTDGYTPVNGPPITPEQLIAAVRAAAQTWMDAVPSVRLVYDGTTTEAPNSANNVIGWGRTTTVLPGGAETRHTPGGAGPTYTGFSVYLYPTESFTYRPCDPAHGKPCDDGPNDNLDLGGLVTHEWGHVLGLDHVENQQTDNELTMYPGGGNANWRHKATLGLGDILGARNLYPTNAALPPIFRP